MSNESWGSLRGFAQIMRCTHGAVQKAISTGRIPETSVKRNQAGRITSIEYRSAARSWNANTDADQSQRATGRIDTAAFAPGPAAAVGTAKQDALVQSLQAILVNSLVPWSALAVLRWGVPAGRALELYMDLVLVLMEGAAEELQLDGDFSLPWPPSFLAAMKPGGSPELLEDVAAVVEIFKSTDTN